MPTSPELRRLITAKKTMAELGIPNAIVTDLIYKILFNEGDVPLGRFVEITKIPQAICDEILGWMKTEHQVEVPRAGSFGSLSYIYRLTDTGRERARSALERTQYVGPAPVPINEYRDAILLQTQESQHITPAMLKQSISHLILPENFDRRIGPAINGGTSIFLYGPPGNGKTTIAQVIGMLLAGSEPVRIPYAVAIGGDVIKIFDPLIHIPAQPEPSDSSMLRLADDRWGLFRRPVVMVGGELEMGSLDLRFEPTSKFYEAPLQMKANSGMFLIDDFGRQQMSPQQLLNRWIVPLESRIDFFRLQSGQTFEIPFRQLIVFSTNLDPKDLVDEAFLRRIQMKVEVGSPDEKLFYQIFVRMCQQFKIPFDKESFVHLVERYYRKTGRTMQSVHPRDILKTVVAICNYDSSQPRLTPALIDEACRGYFVVS
jgi:predicted ATPase with chaperone activity